MTGPYGAILEAWLAGGGPVTGLAERLAQVRAPAVHSAWMDACPEASRLSPRTGREQMVPFDQLHPDDRAVDVATARTVLDPRLVAALLAAGRRQARERALLALAREERAWDTRAGRALWSQARRAVREAIDGLAPKMAALPAVVGDDAELLAGVRAAYEVADPPPAGLADACREVAAREDGRR